MNSSIGNVVRPVWSACAPAGEMTTSSAGGTMMTISDPLPSANRCTDRRHTVPHRMVLVLADRIPLMGRLMDRTARMVRGRSSYGSGSRRFSGGSHSGSSSYGSYGSSRSSYGSGKPSGKSGKVTTRRAKPKDLTKSAPASSLDGNNGLSISDFQIGDRSPMTMYGLGKVIETQDKGANSVITVDFGTDGVKRLLLRVAPIEKL